MCPILFKIAGFPVRSYGVLLVIGIGIAMLWAQKRSTRYRFDSEKLFDLAFWAVVAGVLGARILFIVQEWGYYSKHLDEVFSFQFQGLTSFGGLLFGGAAVLIWCKLRRQPIWPALDILAPPFLVASAIGRIGCFANGCCYGVTTTAPIGVHFEGVPGVHLPAQLFETAILFVFAAGLAQVEARKEFKQGQVTGLSLMLFGVARFIYEFWRSGSRVAVARGDASSTLIPGLPVTEAQVMALAIAFTGIAIFFARQTAASSRHNQLDAGTDSP
ncbi:MAG: prolipoprotein diacylglyceryl transferase [Armatimonadetes bacterium]|nr:prolipoprotein diacylglyceryl transferase [Armatimonadota bacterium]